MEKQEQVFELSYEGSRYHAFKKIEEFTRNTWVLVNAATQVVNNPLHKDRTNVLIGIRQFELL